ncbi:MAG: hypothetical protein J6X86_03340 [Bacteroidales bacterium]|nr:hypothetical protein [Bacteroidales bacterium]
MAGSRVVVRNPHSLDELQEALHFVSDSILKTVAHASEYFDSMVDAMKQQLDVLEEQIKAAREELDRAESDYNDCLSSREYDDDDNSCHQSCDSEENCVNKCKEACEDLNKRMERAKNVLHECEHELEEYRKTPGILTPWGGEKMMEYLAKGHTDKACQKLDQIKECVTKYIASPSSIQGVIERNAEQMQEYEAGLKEIEEIEAANVDQTQNDKVAAFEEASEYIRRQQSGMGFNSADAVAVCPGCGRPVNVCICQHIIERSR